MIIDVISYQEFSLIWNESHEEAVDSYGIKNCDGVFYVRENTEQFTFRRMIVLPCHDFEKKNLLQN